MSDGGTSVPVAGNCTASPLTLLAARSEVTCRGWGDGAVTRLDDGGRTAFNDTAHDANMTKLTVVFLGFCRNIAACLGEGCILIRIVWL